jgi:hypothetical protein
MRFLRRIAFASVAIFSSPAIAGEELNICEREMTLAAAIYKVPLGILYAVGLTETGRKGSGERPSSLLCFELLQKLGRIGDVPSGIKHLCKRSKMTAMIMVVNLHTADVDQSRSVPTGLFEGPNGVLQGGGEERPAVDIHRIGLERTPGTMLVPTKTLSSAATCAPSLLIWSPSALVLGPVMPVLSAPNQGPGPDLKKPVAIARNYGEKDTLAIFAKFST